MKTCHLNVKVVPKASANEIVGWEKEEIKIRVKAQPEKGEANEVLIKFLAKQLDLAQSKIELVSGHTSRHKRLRIEMGKDEVIHKLMEGRKLK